jgi:peptidoglycan/LPS O-acetylase OafA/YrhL
MHDFTHPKYRPDIDGLRAVAVLAVVGFHAFPDQVKGGFVGVDIFFVISGFLISSILFVSLEKDHFSFAGFYARRVRRIFPALILVLATSFGIGWFVLLTGEYKQLGKHILAGVCFVSNFVLWGEAGYFDDAGETKPLLHLWSLGIEEQFYIVWPVLLWLAWRRRFNLFSMTLLIIAGSFAINVITARAHPVAAFYSPLTRFLELMIGSVLGQRFRSSNHIMRPCRACRSMCERPDRR